MRKQSATHNAWRSLSMWPLLTSQRGPVPRVNVCVLARSPSTSVQQMSGLANSLLSPHSTMCVYAIMGLRQQWHCTAAVSCAEAYKLQQILPPSKRENEQATTASKTPQLYLLICKESWLKSPPWKWCSLGLYQTLKIGKSILLVVSVLERLMHACTHDFKTGWELLKTLRASNWFQDTLL